MPTEAQLIEALRTADANGDTAAATRFAEMIKEQRASSAPAAQAPKKSAPITTGDVTRSALQGATLGFSDEIGAGIAAAAAKAAQAVGAIPGDETYMQIYSQMQQEASGKQKQFAQEHPVVDFAAQVVGGAPLGGAAFKGATTLPKIAKAGAKSGALYGGLYGAGTAEQGLEARAKGGATGAAVGAVTGGVLPVAIAGGGRVGQSAIKRAKVALSTKADGAVETFAQAMTDDEAAAIVGEIAQRTGLTTDDIAAKMEKLGPKATLADVDENFAYALHDAISRFSPAKDTVRKQYAERLLGEHGDTLNTLSTHFDNYNGDDVYKALADSAANRKRIAGPLYDKAFSQEFPENLAGKDIFRIENVQDAMQAGMRMAKNDPERIMTVDGEKVLKPIGGVEKLHYAKKALWDQEQSLLREGKKEAARLVGAQRKEVDKILNSIPEYEQARKIWSSSMDADNAAQVGKDIFKLNAREFDEALKGMNPHEIEMAKMGALSSASDKIEGIADRRSVARKLVENESMRKKVQALFGGKEQVEAITKNADKWDAFRRANNILSQQSRTREFSQANQEVNEIVGAMQSGLKEKALKMIMGERMNAERSAAIAKILSKEGITKPDIDRLVSINNKLFAPSAGTAAATMAVTRQATSPLIQMQEKSNNLNDYMR